MRFGRCWVTRSRVHPQSLQEKQYCRLQLNGKTAELWEQFRQAMQSFTEATEHQKIAFEVLKEKDQKSSREIEMQEKKLQKLQVAAGHEGERESRDAPVPLLTFHLSPGLGSSHQGPDRSAPPGERGAERALADGEGTSPPPTPGAQGQAEPGQG